MELEPAIRTQPAPVSQACWWMMAVGTPLGFEGEVSVGNVTNRARYGVIATSQRNFGSSGEPLDYATLHLVGDAIQLVSFRTRGGVMPRRAPGAVEGLSVVLAQRWLERATLPLTQEPMLTRAEESMLQPGDLPASLPAR